MGHFHQPVPAFLDSLSSEVKLQTAEDQDRRWWNADSLFLSKNHHSFNNFSLLTVYGVSH